MLRQIRHCVVCFEVDVFHVVESRPHLSSRSTQALHLELLRFQPFVQLGLPFRNLIRAHARQDCLAQSPFAGLRIEERPNLDLVTVAQVQFGRRLRAHQLVNTLLDRNQIKNIREADHLNQVAQVLELSIRQLLPPWLTAQLLDQHTTVLASEHLIQHLHGERVLVHPGPARHLFRVNRKILVAAHGHRIVRKLLPTPNPNK